MHKRTKEKILALWKKKLISSFLNISFSLISRQHKGSQLGASANQPSFSLMFLLLLIHLPIHINSRLVLQWMLVITIVEAVTQLSVCIQTTEVLLSISGQYSMVSILCCIDSNKARPVVLGGCSMLCRLAIYYSLC